MVTFENCSIAINGIPYDKELPALQNKMEISLCNGFKINITTYPGVNSQSEKHYNNQFHSPILLTTFWYINRLHNNCQKKEDNLYPIIPGDLFCAVHTVVLAVTAILGGGSYRTGTTPWDAVQTLGINTQNTMLQL